MTGEARAGSTAAEIAAEVAALNDAFRKRPAGGLVMLTKGVLALDGGAQERLIEAVRGFDRFTPDNDPYGEHDFGAIDLSGEAFFWKIDTYERSLAFASPDPTDPSLTTRVLTIMRAAEW